MNNKQTRQKLQHFNTFPRSFLHNFILNPFLSFSFFASHQHDKVIDSSHGYCSFLLLLFGSAPAWDHYPSPQGWPALAGRPTVHTSVSFWCCFPPLLATSLYRILLPQLSPWFTVLFLVSVIVNVDVFQHLFFILLFRVLCSWR